MESTGTWGTWEELILGSAVMRHGTRDWNVVVSELCSRTLHPQFFTPEVCKAKFEDLQKRYAGSTSWFEELRKQRVAELKRELARSDDSIGSLESKIKSLEAERQNSNQADYDSPQNESSVPALNSDGTKSVYKEALKDENSAGSFTKDAPTTTWLCERRNQETEIDTQPDVSISSEQGKDLSVKKPKEPVQGMAVKKRRGLRKRKNCHQALEESNNVGSNNGGSTIHTTNEDIAEKSDSVRSCNGISTAKRKFSELAVKEGILVKSDNGESTAKRKDRKLAVKEVRVRNSDNVGSSNTASTTRRKVCNQGIKEGRAREREIVGSSKGLVIARRKNFNSKDGSVDTSDNVGSSNCASAAWKETSVTATDQVTKKLVNYNHDGVAASPIVKRPVLMDIFQSIARSEPATVFRHRMDSQKRARYRKVIKQHLDIGTIRSRIAGKSIKSVKELFRDLLLLANNAMVFYSRRTREYKSALLLRNLVMQEYKQRCRELCREPVLVPPFNPPVRPRTARPRPAARPCREWVTEEMSGCSDKVVVGGVKKETREGENEGNAELMKRKKKGVMRGEMGEQQKNGNGGLRHRKRVRK